jgi:hypothetical protein
MPSNVIGHELRDEIIAVVAATPFDEPIGVADIHRGKRY